MTMHLVGPYLTTTNHKKRKDIKFKSAEHKARYLAEQQAWAELLKRHKIDPKAKKKKAVGKLSDVYKLSPPPGRESTQIVSRPEEKHGIVPGTCTKPVPKIYTGDRLIGIATMHKSNMVPVFKKEDAEDIARMRR
jgi:hypothetical protein